MSSRVSKANLIILPHEYVKAAWVFFDTCFLQDKNNVWKILLKLCSFPLPTAFTFLVSNDGLIYSELSGATSPPLPTPRFPLPTTKGNILGPWQRPIGFKARDSLLLTQRLSVNKKCVPGLSVCSLRSLTVVDGIPWPSMLYPGFCSMKWRAALGSI